MITNKSKFLSIALILSLFFSCKKEDAEPEYTHLMFPIGRSHLGKNQVSIQINEQNIEPDIIDDGFGGYWVKIPVLGIVKPSVIKVSFLRVSQDLSLYAEKGNNIEQYLKPCNYVDSDNEFLKSKAAELCNGLNTNLEKAEKIAQFVDNQLSFLVYKDAFLDNASKTFELKHGICINHSRLTTAICRAAGVPARTVWGVIYNQQENNYDYHHQWTEILDNEGLWHQLDNTINYRFDINDVGYLDLYYAPEQNTFIQKNPEYKFILGDVKFFNGYPASLSGQLHSFYVSDKKTAEWINVKMSYLFK
jgi:transglutaminase-like putative cysteine protease